MKSGKYIAAVGIFDGVHLGHQNMLRRMMACGDSHGFKPLVVTFRQHPSSVLGNKTSFQWLSDPEERVERIKALGVENVEMLDFTPELADLSACEFAEQVLMQRYEAGALFMGYDTKFGNRKRDDFDKLPMLQKQFGFGIFRDEPLMYGDEPISSTRVRKSLAAGDVAMAEHLLGRPYAVCGPVVKGRQVGRQLGFPTANVDLSACSTMIPSDGVYEARVEVEGEVYKALLNLGSQPTFDLPKRTLEVHLLGFEGDLYGRMLNVEFVRRLRDIMKFNSREELMAQLNKDKTQVI